MKITVIFLAVFSSYIVYGQNDLAKAFDDCNVKGSTTIYDYKSKKWITTDINDTHKGTLPASTFKIINTLIALESGVINNENEIIKWPGETDTVKYGHRPDIYHDLTLQEAFRVSAVWVYLGLARKIGKAEYKKILQKSNYGNADVSVDDLDFWNFGKLAISPVNQIEILIGVYEENLPFSSKSFTILKKMMIEEETDGYVLRAKTGLTREDGKNIGWWVGYVEREENIYFFATRIVKDQHINNPDFAKCRKEITKTILKQLNII